MSDQSPFPSSTTHDDEGKQNSGSLGDASGSMKRKRDSSDQDEHSREAHSTGDARRRSQFKRLSPHIPHDGTGQTPDLGDSSTNSFLVHHNPSSTDEDLQPQNTGLDFSAISHQQGEPPNQQNGSSHTSDATSTAAAALAGIYPSITVPQSTELAFANANPGGDSDRHMEPPFAMGEHDVSHGQHPEPNFNLDALREPGQHHIRDSPTSGMPNQKPAVGSEEWHKVRRDNHKEVERRRRETINEGINELAKIVPGCEKNKGSILQRAVQFITQLKENEAQNIEKWTLEKLLTEQAIAELSATVEKLKNECERAWREAETWKKTCQSAGLTPRQSEESTNANGGN
ncbi:hypothetical protein L228DRAFT_129949 [Xylona heveae TC161]|uniref:BHLH domain-containing protein n=1 Tax=Xylona heveae (strain CBS 132557 / TC161) TaxID=1328760 RepID=A0A165GUN5_XYLHT|nr:hypothetical protein L228DRAFT_129949 [Xylona heveae TC161]KZF22615.1 hypothetical protein L228DRAFT_129949 [Xylona heveae TC161]